jgi:hypothetical protein
VACPERPAGPERAASFKRVRIAMDPRAGAPAQMFPCFDIANRSAIGTRWVSPAIDVEVERRRVHRVRPPKRPARNHRLLAGVVAARGDLDREPG